MRGAGRSLLALLLVACLLPGSVGADEDRATAELDRLFQKQIRAFLSLGRVWKKKDPDVAERAFRLVLAMDPANEKAKEGLREIGRHGTLVVLFDGSDVGAWHHLDEPHWRLEGRELRGRCEDAAYLARTLDTFKGSYVVRMEARFLLATSTNATYFAIGGDADDAEGRVQFGLLRGLPYFEAATESGDEVFHRGSLDDVKPRLDIREWHTYELEFLEHEVVARIDGQEIARAERPYPQGHYISLVVQDCEFAIRRVDVRIHD